ncbi:FkbM family methyltransferase [Cupriavidus sp. WS]|uniref:FkbM family methyltransferase n=1 Tax=Cupriavidus sp. WS TaxID=1312922 RepID=UPI00036B710D|nr:FkbM family methyltransferase [Cupriavidus sp. WS]
MPILFPPTEVITSALDGTRYIVFQGPDLISNELRKTGGFETWLRPFFEKLLRNQLPGTILDVGCNIGTFVLPLARQYPLHRFECFDAQRLALYCLGGSIALNSLSNINTYHLALSDRPGEIEAQIPDYPSHNNIGSYSFDAEFNAFHRRSPQGVAVERIPVATLDQGEYTDIRLIKIDVEGMELQVLQGARELLRRNHYPPLVFETWKFAWFAERREALIAWVEALGYEVFHWGCDSFAQHPAREEVIRF